MSGEGYFRISDGIEVRGPAQRFAIYRAHVQRIDRSIEACAPRTIAAAILPSQLIHTADNDGICPTVYARKAGDSFDGAFFYSFHAGLVHGQNRLGSHVDQLVRASRRYLENEAHLVRQAAEGRRHLEACSLCWNDGMALDQLLCGDLMGEAVMAAKVTLLDSNLTLGAAMAIAKDAKGLESSIAALVSRHRIRQAVKRELDTTRGDLFVTTGAQIVMTDYRLPIDEIKLLLGKGHTLEIVADRDDLPYQAADLEIIDGVMGANFYGRGWRIYRETFFPDRDIGMPHSRAYASQGLPFRKLVDMPGPLGDLLIDEVGLIDTHAATITLRMPRIAVRYDASRPSFGHDAVV